MKGKTAAALAIVLIPLLLIGSGVFIASARRGPPSAAVPEAKGSSKVAAWLAEGRVANTPTQALPNSPQPTPVNRWQIRADIVAALDRRRIVGRRSAECKELWPMAETEEEGRALQREKIALDEESGQLYRRLGQLAALDPALIVELVRTAHDVPERLRLAGLISPDVDDEFTTEDAPSGPLLSGLLALASGDAEERSHLASFAGRLSHANRELGRTLLGLMNDEDLNVRINAAISLGALSSIGLLGDLFREQIPALMKATMRNDFMNDYHVRGNALRILASLAVDQADDIVLDQFERLESHNDFDRITAADMAGPRLADRCGARLTMAILRALELPIQSHFHYHLLGVARHLPAAQRETIAQVAELKVPNPDHIFGSVTIGPPRQPRRPSRSLSGVHHWSDYRESGPSSGPSIRR